MLLEKNSPDVELVLDTYIMYSENDTGTAQYLIFAQTLIVKYTLY